jgi:hypothetical protein
VYPFWIWYVITPIWIVVHFVVIGAIIAVKKKRGDFDPETAEDE